MKYVYDYLDKLKIKYSIVNHPEVFTTSEADKYIEGYIGIRTKTMLICNKKKTHYYLVVLDESKRVDFKLLESLLDENKLKFASEEDLLQKLNLPIGSVSIFGLLNNKEKDVIVIIDKDIDKGIPLTFHPNKNTATLFISMEHTIMFLESIGIQYKIIKL